jgi:Cytochrome P450
MLLIASAGGDFAVFRRMVGCCEWEGGCGWEAKQVQNVWNAPNQVLETCLIRVLSIVRSSNDRGSSKQSQRPTGILARLLEVADSRAGTPELSFDEALALTITNIQAPFQVIEARFCLHWPSITGSDTTATTLCAILYYLCKNPSAYRKLQAEVLDAEAGGRISNPITYTEAVKLVYL